MIVLAASVVVVLLTNGVLADSIRHELAGRDESLVDPHLIEVEVISAFRRLVAGPRIDSHRSAQFLAGLAALPAERYSRTAVFGSYGTISPLTMRRTSLWRKQRIPPVHVR